MTAEMHGSCIIPNNWSASEHDHCLNYSLARPDIETPLFIFLAAINGFKKTGNVALQQMY